MTAGQPRTPAQCPTAPERSDAPGGAVAGRRNEIIAFRESSVITLARVGGLDSLQVAAAFRLARLVQQANAEAGARFREYVDGGERTPLAERATEAMRELRKARQMLGKRGFDLALQVCVEGRSLMELDTRRKRDTSADNLRDHLDDLAELWNL